MSVIKCDDDMVALVAKVLAQDGSNLIILFDDQNCRWGVSFIHAEPLCLIPSKRSHSFLTVLKHSQENASSPAWLRIWM